MSPSKVISYIEDGQDDRNNSICRINEHKRRILRPVKYSSSNFCSRKNKPYTKITRVRIHEINYPQEIDTNNNQSFPYINGKNQV